jgi:methyl-accepting chemotaxis protein
MVLRNGQEQGMLDFSKLILAQSEMFSALNEQLMQQEQELRNYADQVEEQRQHVQQYAVQLELQQQELQQHNTLLEQQKTQLQQQTEELSRQAEELFHKSEEISNLNKRFEEVGILVSREGKRTFKELGDSVQSVLEFTQKINGVSSDFQEKLTMIEQSNDLINKISKRVENISYQASVLGGSLPVDHQNRLAFNMMIEEIKKLSVQILEANTAINNLSKEIRPQIRVLVKIAQENQEVVTTLAQNSQNTEMALANLSQLLE